MWNREGGGKGEECSWKRRRKREGGKRESEEKGKTREKIKRERTRQGVGMEGNLRGKRVETERERERESRQAKIINIVVEELRRAARVQRVQEEAGKGSEITSKAEQRTRWTRRETE